MKQLTLFDERMRERFDRFHKDNPRVYALFCQFVDEVIRRGHKHYSSDAICHRIRWHVHVETRSDDGFKLNDHFTAFYARLWLADHPEHPDFFETRVQRSEVA